MNRKNYTQDDNLLLKDAGLVTSSGADQVSSSAKILDLGAGDVNGNMIVDCSACEVNSSDEKYDVCLQGSNSATFASGIVELARLRLGCYTAPCDTNFTTGHFTVPFSNNISGTNYRYVRTYHVIAGTITTGVNYIARLGLNQ